MELLVVVDAMAGELEFLIDALSDTEGVPEGVLRAWQELKDVRQELESQSEDDGSTN